MRASFFVFCFVVLSIPLISGALAPHEVPPPRDGVAHQLRPTTDRAPLWDSDDTPLRLASGDYNEDGTIDLVLACATLDGRGRISVFPGRARWPDDARKATPLFDAPAPAVASPVAPALLASGDFDHDGQLDLIVAAERGRSLYLYRGDGRLGLALSGAVDLGGELISLVAGEFGQPDGHRDLVVAIDRDHGASLLVFGTGPGALNEKPLDIELDFPVSHVALAQLNNHPAIDLVAAGGSRFRVIDGAHGGTAADHDLGEAIEAIAVADSVWEHDHRVELSVLTYAGGLYTLTVDMLRTEGFGQLAPVARLDRNTSSRPRRIIPLRATGQPATELLVLDGKTGLNLMAHRPARRAPGLGSIEATPLAGPAFQRAILLAQPQRLNQDTLDDLIVITTDGELQFLLSAPSAILTVDSADDQIDSQTGDGVCSTVLGNCTLRAAIQEANALPGADSIAFDLPPESLTIAPTGSLPSVSEVVTIDGTTQIGYAGRPLVTIDGTSASSFASGLFLTGGGITVRGLAVVGFGADGIVAAGNGLDVFEGNYVGVDADGVTARPNGVMGITLSSEGNTVGGTTTSAGNLISGNGVYGIWLDSSLASANDILGNRIGSDDSGTSALPNEVGGVTLTGGSNNRIGTAGAGAGNLISGNNGAGVFLQPGSGGSNLIQGNLVGTTLDGVSELGNAGSGITLSGSADTVGGAAGNSLAFNVEAGVRVLGASATGNRIRGNSIFSNGGLGIDLGPVGVTPNDPADPDPGENDLQNFPDVARADARGGQTTVSGSMDGPPTSDILIEFFSSPTCDASGYGEGRSSIGSTTVSTDILGQASFNVSLPAAIPELYVVTATATNPLGSTSEFSACVMVTTCALEVFGQVVLASSPDSLGWTTAADVAWVGGDLAFVDRYDVRAMGSLVGSTELDISMDTPVAGAGSYYLVRPQGPCGSWQTTAGSEPGRDLELP